MQNKLKNLFVMMTLTVMLASLVSVPAQAGPPVLTKYIGLLKETYDDACCDALNEYVRCEDSDSSYKENFKAECSYLGSKLLYSMDDLEALAIENCGYSNGGLGGSIICNFRVGLGEASSPQSKRLF